MSIALSVLGRSGLSCRQRMAGTVMWRRPRSAAALLEERHRAINQIGHEALAAAGLGGKTALVTGAPRSIGRAIAEALAEEGANIVLHYRSRETEAHEAAEVIRKRGVDVLPLSADLTRSSSVQELFNLGIAHFGGLDIVVANAGVGLAAAASSRDLRRRVRPRARRQHPRGLLRTARGCPAGCPTAVASSISPAAPPRARAPASVPTPPARTAPTPPSAHWPRNSPRGASLPTAFTPALSVTASSLRGTASSALR
ncbi:hypothetical protein SANTM175S_03657 [Streptomyces antimycoticus]